MGTILHENISLSPEIADQYPAVIPTFFYRGFLLCQDNPDFCKKTTNSFSDQSSDIRIEDNKVFITSISDIKVRSCRNCEYFKPENHKV